MQHNYTVHLHYIILYLRYIMLHLAGEKRGECVCGQCRCIPPYKGVNCGDIECTILESQTCKQNKVSLLLFFNDYRKHNSVENI